MDGVHSEVRESILARPACDTSPFSIVYMYLLKLYFVSTSGAARREPCCSSAASTPRSVALIHVYQCMYAKMHHSLTKY